MVKMSNWLDDQNHKDEMKRRYPIMCNIYNKHYTVQSHWTKIVVPATDRPMIENFAIKRLEDKQKRNDHGYTVDKHKALERGIIGVVAEWAIVLDAQVHGIKLTMDTTIGSATEHNVPDFPEINTGCKSSKMGNVPVIYKKEHHTYPQIISLVEEQEDGSFIVYVLGVAYPKILNDSRNRSDDGIVDPRMLYKKTAFIGTKWLTPWETYISRVKENMAS